jgi:hypothetical protein
VSYMGKPKRGGGKSPLSCLGPMGGQGLALKVRYFFV